MLRLTKLLAAAATSAVVLASAGNAFAQEYTFKLHHLLSAKAPAHTKMLVPWAKQVEENSGGKVKIEIYPSMSLDGKPPELIQQARDGVVDIVWTVMAIRQACFHGLRFLNCRVSIQTIRWQPTWPCMTCSKAT